MTVFRQIMIASALLTVGFVVGVWCQSKPAAPVTTITDTAGNVLTPAQFAQLMQLQCEHNAQEQAAYAETIVKQQAEYDSRMDRYFAMLSAKARYDYNLGIIHRSDSGVLLERHIHALPRHL